MSAPRTKRQFAGAASDPAQRRITSFFNSSGATPLATHSDEAPRAFASTDASVQANLLSVGMRVRKAIPEGYKSGTYSAFSLWDENNKITVPNSAAPNADRPRPSGAPAQRELLPFCGINRIGGLDSQGFSGPAGFAFGIPPTDDPLTLLDPDTMEDIPGLTLSQQSTDSNDSAGSDMAGAKTRKRFFADDDVTEIPDRLSVADWQDVAVSPRSLAPVSLGNSRRLAVPRTKGLRGKVETAGGFGPAGQENFMIVDTDFEDAPFLDPGLEVDMDDF